MSHGMIYCGKFHKRFGERLMTTTLMILCEYRGLSDGESRLRTLVEISDSFPLGALAFSVDWIAGLLSLHPRDLQEFLKTFLDSESRHEKLVLTSSVALESDCLEQTYYRDVAFPLVAEVVEAIIEGAYETEM